MYSQILESRALKQDMCRLILAVNFIYHARKDARRMTCPKINLFLKLSSSKQIKIADTTDFIDMNSIVPDQRHRFGDINPERMINI